MILLDVFVGGMPDSCSGRTRAAPAGRADRLGGWHTARRALGARVRNQTCKVSDLFSDGKDFVPQLRIAGQKWACRPPAAGLWAGAGRPSRCRTKAFVRKKRLRSFRKTGAVVFVFERSRFRAAEKSRQSRWRVAARASRCGSAAGVAEATGGGRRGDGGGRSGQRSLRARRWAPCLR